MPARRHPKSVQKKNVGRVKIAAPLAGPAPDLMVPGEAAAYVRLTVSGIYERAARPEDPTRARNGSRNPIAVLRFGKMLRFRREDLDAWVARHQAIATAQVEKVKAAR